MKDPGILIIGNGGAAANAVLAARASGYMGTISIVSDVDEPAFNPMLSPYYLAGKISIDQCFPFGNDFYERNGVICHFGSPVVELDHINKKVYLKNGNSHSYDKCLIATGASPILPDVRGLKKSEQVITLRTASDVHKLQEALSSAKTAVILGASLVGVKLADILNTKGVKTALVDVADHVLPQAAHAVCAAKIENHITRNGVDLHLAWSLQEVEYNGKEVLLHFNEKDLICADLCIVCTGVRPNLDFLKNSDVEMDRGILIDQKMRTSADSLYAAGDVSQGMNLLSGKRELIGLWGNACYQGRTAGLNMAGGDVHYPGTIPEHISTFFGLTFVHLGDVHCKGSEIKELSNNHFSENGAFTLLVFDKGVVAGANLINNFQNAGRIKRAIIRELDWDQYMHRILNNPVDTEITQILAMLNA